MRTADHAVALVPAGCARSTCTRASTADPSQWRNARRIAATSCPRSAGCAIRRSAGSRPAARRGRARTQRAAVARRRGGARAAARAAARATSLILLKVADRASARSRSWPAPAVARRSSTGASRCACTGRWRPPSSATSWRSAGSRTCAPAIDARAAQLARGRRGLSASRATSSTSTDPLALRVRARRRACAGCCSSRRGSSARLGRPARPARPRAAPPPRCAFEREGHARLRSPSVDYQRLPGAGRGAPRSRPQLTALGARERDRLLRRAGRRRGSSAASHALSGGDARRRSRAARAAAALSSAQRRARARRRRCEPLAGGRRRWS